MISGALELGDPPDSGCWGIEKQLMRLDGVSHMSVNLVWAITTIDYDPAKTTVPALKAAIDERDIALTRRFYMVRTIKQLTRPADNVPNGFRALFTTAANSDAAERAELRSHDENERY